MRWRRGTDRVPAEGFPPGSSGAVLGPAATVPIRCEFPPYACGLLHPAQPRAPVPERASRQSPGSVCSWRREAARYEIRARPCWSNPVRAVRSRTPHSNQDASARVRGQPPSAPPRVSPVPEPKGGAQARSPEATPVNGSGRGRWECPQAAAPRRCFLGHGSSDPRLRYCTGGIEARLAYLPLRDGDLSLSALTLQTPLLAARKGLHHADLAHGHEVARERVTLRAGDRQGVHPC